MFEIRPNHTQAKVGYYKACLSWWYRRDLKSECDIRVELQTWLEESADPERKYHLLLALGNFLLRNQKIQEAITTYQELLALRPNDIEATYNLSIAIHSLNAQLPEKGIKPNLPKPDLENPGIELEDPYIYYNRALGMDQLGHYKEAIANFEKSIRINRNFYQAWFGRGLTLAKIGYREKALESFYCALKIDKNSHIAWYKCGVIFSEVNQHQSALEHYDRVLDLAPDYWLAWYGRGFALQKLDRGEAALESYGRALKIKPNLFQAWYSCGLILHKLGQYKEAQESYDHALKVKPDFHQAWYEKARCHALQDKLSLALDDLKNAVKLSHKYRRVSVTDSHFSSMRQDPRFQDLVNPNS